jgi:hypothetical protein
MREPLVVAVAQPRCLPYDVPANAVAHAAAVRAAGARVVVFFAGSTGGGYERAAGRSGTWSSGGAVVAQAGSEPGAVARATLG